MSGPVKVSFSRMDKFAKCGEQFRRSYVLGDWGQPTLPMIRGKSGHAGTESNFRHKLETGEDLPIDKLLEEVSADFDIRSRQNILLPDDMAGVPASKIISTTKDQLIQATRNFHTHIAPVIVPDFIEEKIVLTFQGIEITMVIDLADKTGSIHDWKFGRLRKLDDANTDQLSMYAYGYHHKTGTMPRDVRLHGVNQDAWNTVVGTRTKADHSVLSRKIKTFVKATAAGIYLPAVQGSWWCSKKWCQYWSDCKYVNPQATEPYEV